jgi:hypothetical protein
MTDGPELHDFSRLDAHMASVRRTALLHSAWRPMLAGAIGASLIIAAVYVTLPKFTVREVVADHVIQHDVPFDNHVPQNKPFDNYIPRNAPGPIAANPPPVAALPAPKTLEERKFVSRPEYETAQVKGRLVEDKDGQIRFDTGAVFVPMKIDPASGRDAQDYDAEYVTEAYWGDVAFCNAIPAVENRFKCIALHRGVPVDLSTTYRLKATRSRSQGQRARNVRPT